MGDNDAVAAKQREAAEQQTELVIGLVGAVGVDLASVAGEVAATLNTYGYTTDDLHLTDALRELDWDRKLPGQDVGELDRIWAYMDAGAALRAAWKRDDAFGLLAVNAIQRARYLARQDDAQPARRHAYVLRSLKRSDEIKLLRNVYGSRFIQLSVYSPESVRRENLEKKLRLSQGKPRSPASGRTVDQIIQRDQAEEAEHGQEVRKIFPRGDFFVDVREAQRDIERVIEILFGHPNRTPTDEEAGMFHAVAASLRSSELGRQVGAAVCDPDGSLIAVGYNDVPKRGGGLYTDGDARDAREFQLGYDTNDRMKRKLAADVAGSLRDAGLSNASVEELSRHLASSRIDHLIEFVRAVHAEMAAITDAARRGCSVNGATLYATTFPCHHCARHIIATGIVRVVYIEPYPKSLAAELHADAVMVDPAHATSETHVVFKPFVGVGPRRYRELFTKPRRKDESGEAIKPDPKSALPRINGIETHEMLGNVQAHIARERRAMEILAAAQENLGPRFGEFLDAS